MPLNTALLLAATATLSLPTQTPSTAAVPSHAFEPADRDAYILGPGDVLDVIVEGGATPAVLASGLFPQSVCTVSSDGVLAVSGIGQVSVEGLTIAEAEIELARLTRSYYPGMRIGISLSTPRLVRVRASGAVSTPGIYAMYALQSVSDLLVEAGAAAACSRTGWVYSDGDSLLFDLRTDPATHMPVSDPLLAGGTTVMFSTCEHPAYVVRPSQEAVEGVPAVSMIQAWEVERPLELALFLEMTGGAWADFDPGRSGLLHGGTLAPIWGVDGLADLFVEAGDTLFLAGAETKVTVAGAVAAPGVHDWIAGLAASDYVGLSGGALPDAALGGMRIMRDGEIIASGRDASGIEPSPGDMVEVPFKWATRSMNMFVILGSVVSAAAIIINLSQ